MPYGSNEIETRFTGEIDEQDFDRIDSRLEETADNAVRVERAVAAVPAGMSAAPLPFDTASMQALDKSSKKTSANLRLVQLAMHKTGGEAGLAAASLVQTAHTMKMAGAGIGKGGMAATAAMVALGLAVVYFAEQNKKAARDMENILDRQFTANEMEVMSYQQLLDIREKAETENVIFNKNIADANDARLDEQEKFNKQRASIFEGGIGANADVLRSFGLMGGALDKAGDKLTEETEKRDDNAAIIAKATELLEADTQARSEQILAEVDQLGEMRKFEQQALAGSAEENAKRAQSIANDTAIVREQIAVLEASGDTSKAVQDRIAELNNKLEQLGQQSDILSSSAVKAAEAQKKQADASGELTVAAEKAAEAMQATRDAQSAQTASMREFILEAGQTDNEMLELQAEQKKKLVELHIKGIEAEEKIQRDWAKKKEDFAKNQKFLALFDESEKFSDEEQARKQARSKRAEELREELQMEREEKQAAAVATQADKMMQIHQEARLVGDAVAKEQQLLKNSRADNLTILQSGFDQQRQVYRQAAADLAQFGAQFRQSIGQMTGGMPGGAGAGAVGNSIYEQTMAILKGIGI